MDIRAILFIRLNDMGGYRYIAGLKTPFVYVDRIVIMPGMLKGGDPILQLIHMWTSEYNLKGYSVEADNLWRFLSGH